MTLDYFYGQAGELFSFFRIPKALFQEQRFQNLSTDAKTLYGILLDRMSLSVKNEWFDKKGRVFIIFTIEDVKRTFRCADNKATKLLRELEEFGLIERKRRGLGRPSLVYVKNFSAESSKSIFQNRDFHDSGHAHLKGLTKSFSHIPNLACPILCVFVQPNQIFQVPGTASSLCCLRNTKSS